MLGSALPLTEGVPSLGHEAVEGVNGENVNKTVPWLAQAVDPYSTKLSMI